MGALRQKPDLWNLAIPPAEEESNIRPATMLRPFGNAKPALQAPLTNLYPCMHIFIHMIYVYTLNMYVYIYIYTYVPWSQETDEQPPARMERGRTPAKEKAGIPIGPTRPKQCLRIWASEFEGFQSWLRITSVLWAHSHSLKELLYHIAGSATLAV